MSQNDPWAPGQVTPPPPPQYPVTSDIPPDSPPHYSPAPSSGGRGPRGGLGAALLAAWGVIKYGLLFAFKIPAFGTIVSLVVSFGGYALFFGPWFAVALLTMIFVHEMGHVFEIRRQGMKATAPIFIPFMGAAIFQKSHPTTAYKQGLIGIAGPILGTVGASVAAVGYMETHWAPLLLAAWIGFYINLFNLIPIGMLDGSWILGAVSPYFQVGALVLIGLAAYNFHLFVSPLLIIFALLGIPNLISRFREAKNPYYASVPASGRGESGVARW